MTCEDALILISGHLDQENTPEEEAQLQSHLAQCAQCRELLETFREIDSGVADLEEEVPAGLRQDVMAAIRKEAAPRKHVKRKSRMGLAVAAALLLVVGAASLQLPGVHTQETASPMMARSMPAEEIADYSVASAPAEYTLMEDAAAVESDMVFVEISPQALADARQADVAVTYELLPEMEVCQCETLENGALLYDLEQADGAASLSRLYGVELYQPAVNGGGSSYALLLPKN